MTSPRQPAYDAVYAVIHQHPPRSTDDYNQAAENGRVWSAVEAALDAMGVPDGDKSAAPVEHAPRVGWHVEDCRCLECDGAVLNVDPTCHIP